MFAHFLVRDTLCPLGSGLECIDWTSGYRDARGVAKPFRDALGASLLVTRRADGESALWGRLGRPDLRDSAVLEYRQGGAWRPVKADDVRDFSGGGEDGIFSLRVSGVDTDDFRIATR